MRDYLGFRCDLCQYENEFHIGMDFRDGKIRNLYCCDNCQMLYGNKYVKHKCNKCGGQSFTILEIVNGPYRCPSCLDKSLIQTHAGFWS